MAELSLKRHYREYPRGGQRERQFSQLLYATHEPVFHCVAGMSAALMKKKTNWCTLFITTLFYLEINPFAPGDFAEKRVLKLVEWFSGHCRAIKS